MKQSSTLANTEFRGKGGTFGGAGSSTSWGAGKDIAPEVKNEKKEGAAKEDIYNKQHKTTGEKWYSRLRFGVAEAFIMGMTAVIAYAARHGTERWNSINIFKWLQGHAERLMAPMEAWGNRWKRIAGAVAATLVTFHGGNAFAPIMKKFADKKIEIVNFFNKRGKPGELELGEERVKHEPKQGWGDVITGRIGAFLTVFGSFMTADLLLGKNQKTGAHWFDALEDGFGRLVSLICGNRAPVSTEGVLTKLFPKRTDLLPETSFGYKHMGLEEAAFKQHYNTRSYRFGKILALDIYATTAGIVIWGGISRYLANRRAKKEVLNAHAPVINDNAADQPGTDESALADVKTFTSKQRDNKELLTPNTNPGSETVLPPTETELAAHERQRERFRKKPVEASAGYVDAAKAGKLQPEEAPTVIAR